MSPETRGAATALVPVVAPSSLEHHYVAYRAHVRSKVACLRAEQGDDGAAREARRLHALAVRHLEAG